MKEASLLTPVCPSESACGGMTNENCWKNSDPGCSREVVGESFGSRLALCQEFIEVPSYFSCLPICCCLPTRELIPLVFILWCPFQGGSGTLDAGLSTSSRHSSVFTKGLDSPLATAALIAELSFSG